MRRRVTAGEGEDVKAEAATLSPPPTRVTPSRRQSSWSWFLIIILIVILIKMIKDDENDLVWMMMTMMVVMVMMVVMMMIWCGWGGRGLRRQENWRLFSEQGSLFGTPAHVCGDDDRDHDVADHDNHEQVNGDLELQPMPMCVSMMMLLLMIIIYQGLSMCLIKIVCYTMYSSYNINIIYMMMILVMMITICTNCILIYYKQQGSSQRPPPYMEDAHMCQSIFIFLQLFPDVIATYLHIYSITNAIPSYLDQHENPIRIYEVSLYCLPAIHSCLAWWWWWCWWWWW